jgi:hypothetical protein
MWMYPLSNPFRLKTSLRNYQPYHKLSQNLVLEGLRLFQLMDNLY